MTKKCVCVQYNGYYLVPAPILSISRSFQDDGTGRTIGSTLNIKLEGKIVNARPLIINNVPETRAEYLARIASSYSCITIVGSPDPISPPTTSIIGTAIDGINTLMEEERAFRKVFSNSKYNYSDSDALGNLAAAPNPIADLDSNRLKIIANGNNIVDGFAKVVGYSANPTNNNWVNTIDYSVELVIEEPATQFLGDTTSYLVNSVTDDMTVEPLDEVHPFRYNDPIFSSYFGGSIQENSLWHTNYPSGSTRYRISRNVSAVGKHSHNEQAASITETAPGALTSANNDTWNSVLNDSARVPRALVSAGTGTAFINARAYVLDRLRHYPTKFYLDDWIIVNRVRTITPNELGGSFGINEICIAIHKDHHPPWADDWSAEVSVDSTFLQTVRINGTIKGYETYGNDILLDNIAYNAKPKTINANNSPLHTGIIQPVLPPVNGNASAPYGGTLVGKYQNAISGIYWLKGGHPTTPGFDNAYLSPIARRAELFFVGGNSNNNNSNNPYRWLNSTNIRSERVANTSPFQMNPIPISMTESHRSHVGEIDYSFEFNNRPLNLIRGSVSETLNISDSFPVQQIAEIFVLGRKLGPVLQDLNTVSAASRELTLEVVLPRPRSLSDRTIFPTDAYKAATGIVEQFNPKYMFGDAGTTIKSFVKTDNQNWNPFEGRLSITKGWTWQRGK